MRYRKLTEDGDYSFGAGQLDFYRDVPEAVGQAAITRLLLWLGEWFLNIDEGTPFMQGILGKHSEEVANITIQDRIEGTEGLVNIEQYESVLDPDNRGLSVRAEINTIYGPTVVQVENYRNY
jgi:hypothetical protein